MIDLESLTKIANLYTNIKSGWFQHSDNIRKIYGNEDYKNLIDEFEIFLDKTESKKKPHLALIFYSSLLILNYDSIKDVAVYAKNRTSLKLLSVGLGMFLQSKYSNIKYEVKFNINYYSNKLRFISILSGNIPDIENQFNGFLLAFKMIYYADEIEFYYLLKKDHQNAVFLYFMVSKSLKLSYQDLLVFLNSTDDLKSIGSLYYIMSYFESLCTQYKFKKEDEKIGSKLNGELVILETVFNKIIIEKRIDLIIHYIFENEQFPSFFIDELISSPMALIIKKIKKQKLDNLLNLIKVEVFIKELKEKKLQTLFKNYFISWCKCKGNIHIWERSKLIVFRIINLCTKEIQEELKKELKNIQHDLFTTDFDKQVRYSLYLKDKPKDEIIEEITQKIFM